ncbi:Uncharacterized protein BM_BM13154 [Brugia malayi]|uniref:Bm13154 n=1 Tax=Brugia malayi TaxID=6279 RepID=A0A0J9XZE9_BRUMA|nr:Uncharacterized protein BM_BM13154 [Brugia malayi]CDP99085.1 Bm13154 [Brugia malayi]VIO91359.1 Uncharacterized protein BM_BM13154 [Brugia malayi]
MFISVCCAENDYEILLVILQLMPFAIKSKQIRMAKKP